MEESNWGFDEKGGLCSVRVHSTSWDILGSCCGRPAVGWVRRSTVERACRLHIAGRKRSEAKTQEYTSRREARDALLAEVQVKCDQLASLGINATPEHSGMNHHLTGRVAVDPDVLLGRLA